MATAYVAAEDRHRPDAERKREERLVHRLDHDAHDAYLADRGEVGNEVERDALSRAREHQASHREDEDEGKEAHHENLCHALKPTLQPCGAYDDGSGDDRDSRRMHRQRFAQHRTERAANARRVEAGKTARRHPAEVNEHPPRDDSVEHHQDETPDEAADAVETPCLLLRDERLVHLRDRPPGGATGRELHDEDRYPEKRETGEIRKDEKPAARLARDIREAPYVSEPYRASGGKQYEAEAACELLPHLPSPFPSFSPPSAGTRLRMSCAFSIALR